VFMDSQPHLAGGSAVQLLRQFNSRCKFVETFFPLVSLLLFFFSLCSLGTIKLMS
jgi:hypothetical protein